MERSATTQKRAGCASRATGSTRSARRCCRIHGFLGRPVTVAGPKRRLHAPRDSPPRALRKRTGGGRGGLAPSRAGGLAPKRFADPGTRSVRFDADPPRAAGSPSPLGGRPGCTATAARPSVRSRTYRRCPTLRSGWSSTQKRSRTGAPRPRPRSAGGISLSASSPRSTPFGGGQSSAATPAALPRPLRLLRRRRQLLRFRRRRPAPRLPRWSTARHRRPTYWRRQSGCGRCRAPRRRASASSSGSKRRRSGAE